MNLLLLLSLGLLLRRRLLDGCLLILELQEFLLQLNFTINVTVSLGLFQLRHDLGTGFRGWESIAPTGTRVELVHGPQGGYHIYARIRQTGLGPDVNVSFSVRPMGSTMAINDTQPLRRRDRSGLVRAASVDLAPRGILVNAVLPSVIDTEMTRAMLSPEQVDFVAAQTGFVAGPRTLGAMEFVPKPADPARKLLQRRRVYAWC